MPIFAVAGAAAAVSFGPTDRCEVGDPSSFVTTRRCRNSGTTLDSYSVGVPSSPSKS